MTCYDLLVKLSQTDRYKIYIDLCNKTIKVNGKPIISCGEVERHEIVGEEFDELINEALDIDDLYEQYKYSLPNEREDCRHYFKALSANELTDAQLVLGMKRYEARVRLEAYILLASLTGMLEWKEPNHFYWRSERDGDFVILKKYI